MVSDPRNGNRSVSRLDKAEGVIRIAALDDGAGRAAVHKQVPGIDVLDWFACVGCRSAVRKDCAGASDDDESVSVATCQEQSSDATATL